MITPRHHQSTSQRKTASYRGKISLESALPVLHRAPRCSTRSLNAQSYRIVSKDLFSPAPLNPTPRVYFVGCLLPISHSALYHAVPSFARQLLFPKKTNLNTKGLGSIQLRTHPLSTTALQAELNVKVIKNLNLCRRRRKKADSEPLRHSACSHEEQHARKDAQKVQRRMTKKTEQKATMTVPNRAEMPKTSTFP